MMSRRQQVQVAAVLENYDNVGNSVLRLQCVVLHCRIMEFLRLIWLL